MSILRLCQQHLVLEHEAPVDDLWTTVDMPTMVQCCSKAVACMGCYAAVSGNYLCWCIS